MMTTRIKNVYRLDFINILCYNNTINTSFYAMDIK